MHVPWRATVNGRSRMKTLQNTSNSTAMSLPKWTRLQSFSSSQDHTVFLPLGVYQLVNNLILSLLYFACDSSQTVLSPPVFSVSGNELSGWMTAVKRHDKVAWKKSSVGETKKKKKERMETKRWKEPVFTMAWEEKICHSHGRKPGTKMRFSLSNLNVHTTTLVLMQRPRPSEVNSTLHNTVCSP